jgi:hypothetical protein
MAGISLLSIVRAIGISRVALCGELANNGFVLQGMGAGMQRPLTLKQHEPAAQLY